MRKFMKRAASTALAAAMVFSLAACGQDGGDTTEGTTAGEGASSTTEAVQESDITGEITVLTQRTDLVDTDFADYAKQFEEKYPGTEVKFEAMENYEDDIAIRLNAGDYGDVCMVPTSVAAKDYSTYFEALGTVEELSAQYDEKFLTSRSYNGTVYGLPSGANASGIAYNKRIFEEAGVEGVPSSAEEFIDALKKVKENTEAIPYYTNYHDTWALSQWQSYVGAVSGDSDYVNNKMCNEQDPFAEGKPGYKVYNLLYQIVENGLCEADPVTSDWEASKTMINNGEIASMVMGSWAVSQFKEAGDHPDDIGYLPFPVAAEDGKVYTGADADYSYGIPTSSDNKATARAWIDFMLNESGFAEKQGEISIVKGAALPENLADFEGVEFIVTNVATAENDGKWDAVHNESELNLWGGSSYQAEIIDTALGQSQSGFKSFDDVMAEWNKKWNAALESVNETWGQD
ncbi:MAG: ABC transporter substrate-binding protein [Lachnospiraceae bacterium]|nr:ABC transporter substrate-binding protein [Lachnospiraceae bacterium]